MQLGLNRKGTLSKGIAKKQRKTKCRITPKQEKCAKCGKRKVRHHHRLCDYCWNKRYKEEKSE